MNRVSIIMGIYNCASTLPTAIESILNQTFLDWKLIMCDDGSTDNTFDVARGFAEQYPSKIILLQNKENKRLAATLNRCLEVATGEYIARMDADDESLPERLEKEVEFLDAHPEIACVGTDMIVFDEQGERVRTSTAQPSKKSMLHGVPLAHPTIMMRKEVYDNLGGYTSSKDTMRAEDVDLWFRFFEKGYKGAVIHEPLYRYRESKSDFKKRNFKAAIGTTRVCLKGFKRLGFPVHVYPYAFKPIIVSLVPKGIMYRYHFIQDKMN